MTTGASHTPGTTTTPGTTATPGTTSKPGTTATPGAATTPGAVPARGAAAAREAVTIHVLRVSEHASAAGAPGALRTLSDEERARAAAFLRPADRDRYRVAHVALRRELATLLGTSPADVPLTRTACPLCGGPHGRPSVVGDPLHFSLSHAGDLVLLAFAEAVVGVDVEEHPDAGTVAETTAALHARERTELAGTPEVERPAAFARCWTRKEAYLKGTGTGLGEDPSVTYVSALGDPVSPPGWLLTDLDVPPGHAAASALLTRTGHPSTP